MAQLFLTRAEIEAAQFSQLRRLISALGSNPFYARKLEPAGTSQIASLGEFTRRFPFTTKQELVEDQAAAPPYGTNLTFPLDRYSRCHQTSGTTGQPLRWLDTAESWHWMVASWKEIFYNAGLDRADRVLFAFSFGPFLGFWLAFEAAAEIGALCFPGGGMNSASRLHSIVDNGLTVLCCTPTYALRLAESAAEEKIDLARTRIRLLVLAGEPGASIPSTRARLENAWPGARIFDHHGMTEVGPVTYECREKPGRLHVIESAYFAEVIDPATGEPAPSGAQGELVLTTLGRTGSPLLRYRTGDLVKPATHPPSDRQGPEPEPCLCGRFELALDGGILGRADDMITVRGVNVYPSAVESVLRNFIEVTEYQVEISRAKTLTEMLLRIEPAQDCGDPAGLVKRIEKAFQTAFQLRVPVAVAPPASLPRFEMKAKRWLVQPAE